MAGCHVPVPWHGVELPGTCPLPCVPCHAIFSRLSISALIRIQLFAYNVQIAVTITPASTAMKILISVPASTYSDFRV